jgi:formylglycine-generating enzyme
MFRPVAKYTILTASGLFGMVFFARPGASQLRPCEANMVAIPATNDSPGFCIDRYEASLRHEGHDGVEAAWSPFLTPDEVDVRAVSVQGVVPQAYVSQRQAESACRAVGKRLCSDGQWIRACRGPDDHTYGYGNRRVPGRCNENHRWHPVMQMFRATGEALWGHEQLNDPQLNQLPGTVALTGAHSGCANAYGVYDMVGNLHEWTSDHAGTFRGGYYMDTSANGNGCNYVTRAHSTSYHDYSIGFRCCAALQVAPESR